MELNTILIALGVVALIILVVHGIWANRREKSRYFKNAETFTKDSRLREPPASIKTAQHSPVFDSTEKQDVLATQQSTLNFEGAQDIKDEDNLDRIKISIPNTQSSYMDGYDGEPKQNNYSEENVLQVSMTSSNVENISATAEFSHHSHMNMTQDTVNASSPELKQDVVASSEPQTKPEFLMLYVVAADGFTFAGEKLAKILDELGFIFGDKYIYHRHSDLSINSPVLFSLANIEQPGTFPYSMQDFFTVGVALFIQFPSEGNDLANLRMMIRAAKCIAEELQGFVLTREQSIFDDNAEHLYLSYVR